ncbi:MAG: ferrous iron transport protein A [Deltaproteobacteria bacterium]|nr:ferrous iron transport protein A [Deltaproteobacteria bacterium]
MAGEEYGRNRHCRRIAGEGETQRPGCRRGLTFDGERPLTLAGCGRRLRVCRIDGGRGVCARMAALGIFPGQEVELVCAADRSRCLVRLNGSTVSLGDGAAENILVSAA